jgi:hypothetical protein
MRRISKGEGGWGRLEGKSSYKILGTNVKLYQTLIVHVLIR